MAFHVFVEGATDATPAGVERLANAIAQHYGLPAADLLARLQKGRFRVKGNIDRATAEKYQRDLQILGARCVIEEADAQNSQRATPLPFPAVRPATPVAGTPVAKPATPPAAKPATPPPAAKPATPAPAAKPATSPSAAKPATPPSGTPQYQSGLAAAFSGEQPAASLGALESDNLSFSLASVDGADEQAAGGASFEPPAGSMSASIGPPPEKPKARPGAKPEKPKDVPLDLFAPPDAESAALSVDIAADEVETTAKKRAATPVPADDPSRYSAPALPDPPPVGRQSAPAIPTARNSQPAIPTTRNSQPAIAAEPVDVVKRSKLGPLADARVRFAAGVLLAIVIGFVPAHLVAASRETSAFKAIDDKVLASQQLADTPEAYAMLDGMRAAQLERKKGEQRNAAIIAFAIWALVGGGLAFAWFKKIPWDDLE